MSSARNLVARTLAQTRTYGNWGGEDDASRKLGIAKGVIERLRSSVGDLKDEVAALVRSNEARQETIEAMVDEGCCRALVDRIMDDAKKDIHDSIEKQVASEELAEVAKGENCINFRMRMLAIHSIMMTTGGTEMDDLRDGTSPIGSQEQIDFYVPRPRPISEEARRLLDLTQGSQEDIHLGWERTTLAKDVRRAIVEECGYFCDVGQVRTCGNPDCLQFHISITKRQMDN